MSQEEYAYGDWEVDGVSCPVDSAGFTDREAAVEVGEDFDGRVKEELDEYEQKGCVPKELAEDIFNDLKGEYESRLKYNPDMTEYYKARLDLIEEVIEMEFQ